MTVLDFRYQVTIDEAQVFFMEVEEIVEFYKRIDCTTFIVHCKDYKGEFKVDVTEPFLEKHIDEYYIKTLRHLRNTIENSSHLILRNIINTKTNNLYKSLHEEFDRIIISDLYNQNGGNQSSLTEFLGINRGTMRKILKRLKLIKKEGFKHRLKKRQEEYELVLNSHNHSLDGETVVDKIERQQKEKLV